MSSPNLTVILVQAQGLLQRLPVLGTYRCRTVKFVIAPPTLGYDAHYTKPGQHRGLAIGRFRIFPTRRSCGSNARWGWDVWAGRVHWSEEESWEGALSLVLGHLVMEWVEGTLGGCTKPHG